MSSTTKNRTAAWSAANPGAFPMGFWNYCDFDSLGPDAVADWADAGMTLTLSQNFDPTRHSKARFRAVLDAAHRRKIRIIVCDSRSPWPVLSQGEDAYRRGMVAAIKDFGKHPAVVGFHVGDEPGVREFDDACKAMRIQKELAPDLTPFLNLLPWYNGIRDRVGFARWSDYLDAYVDKAKPEFLCYDCYTQMNPLPAAHEGDWGWDMYFTNLREFHEASQRHGIPFWTTLLSVGHFKYRPPREDDLRWQVNTAAAHGAKGLLWFFFYMRTPHENYRVSPIDEHGERTETFEWLSRVTRTFLKQHAPVLSTLTLRQAVHTGRAWGGFPSTFAADSVIDFARADQPLVVSEFADPAGRPYVAVVNNSQTDSTQAQVCVRGQHPAVYRVGWESQENLASGTPPPPDQTGPDFAVVHPWLAPGQMELYRIQPDGSKA